MVGGESRTFGPLGDYVADAFRRWRSGGSDGQLAVVVLLSVVSMIVLVAALTIPDWFTVGVFILPLLGGMLLLRTWPLFVFACANFAIAVLSLIGKDMTPFQTPILWLLCASAIVVFQSSLFHSGLPGTLSGAMLSDLHDKLQAQSHIGPLPPGWRAQTEMATAGGIQFAGDFVVANVSSDRLEVVLVDVSGKGVPVATSALQFAGAMGGLLGSMPPTELFTTASAFLLRQDLHEQFATAVHVSVDLTLGDYVVTSAGHPPAMHWCAVRRTWEFESARGMALGIQHDAAFVQSTGRLNLGDALLLYTDGIVEGRGKELAEALEWVRAEASQVVANGFVGAAARLLQSARNPNDDRAVVIIERTAP